MADKQDKADIGESDTAHLDVGDDVGDEAAAADDPQNADTAKRNAADPKAADKVADESAAAETQPTSTRPRLGGRISVSVRTLLVAMLIAVLVAAVGVLTWLYLGEKAKLDQQARLAANNSRAERIALDYAVNAAKIDAHNLGPWKQSLVAGTTVELKDKLSGAATAMEQILEPLQWSSTATPLVAKVRSTANGIYVVDTFVGVVTKTIQAPDGLQSTATYSITIDTNHDWQISDVGGIGSVVGQK